MGFCVPPCPISRTVKERRNTVESKPAFKPVTMTLESLEEVEHLTHALRLYEEFHAENSPEARFAREVHSRG